MPTELAAGPILVLAPVGRDAKVIAGMVSAAGLEADTIASFDDRRVGLGEAAGLVVAEEAFERLDPQPLRAFLETQPPWSDFPIILLRNREAPVRPHTQASIERLGNVTVLERPLHPISLVSAARSVVRTRRRQRDAEAMLLEQLRTAQSLRESEERFRGLADQLERRVQDRTAELAAANRQLLAEMAERERVEATMMHMQRLEAVGQLTAGVAHDFNNLLTVVLGNLARLEKSAAADDRRRLAMMRIAAERGAKLTRQLLAFSRRQKLEPKPVDLNDAILSLLDLLRSTLGGAVTLETRLRSDPWPALVDPTQIEMIILNLAINARDAMEAGGLISLETENVTIGHPRTRPEEPEPGEYVMLCVRDNGSGMDEAVLARAFEPFFTTKEVGRGSGLGLSQVLGLCKQSGGGVRIDTEVGVGTSVCIFLPRAQSAASATQRHAFLSQSLEAKDAAILLVDDDEAVRDTTAHMLRELGFTVIQVGSGGGALEILDSERRIDLMLVDFAMPGMNGAEVARAAAAKRPGLPILFVTGYADISAMTNVGHQVLRKPFEERELAERLAKALGAGAACQGA
ncbi:MAG TPA: response regulator [Caulobacteraceae bacterium]|nr:response regulator [Caulobacteraceae bacterium]